MAGWFDAYRALELAGAVSVELGEVLGRGGDLASTLALADVDPVLDCSPAPGPGRSVARPT